MEDKKIFLKRIEKEADAMASCIEENEFLMIELQKQFMLSVVHAYVSKLIEKQIEKTWD